MATNTHNDSLSDDDPTNELPVLDPDLAVVDTPVSAEGLDSTSHIPLSTLDADTDQEVADVESARIQLIGEIELLQQEIAALRRHQTDLENELEQRDAAISNLTEELSDSRQQAAQRQKEHKRLADDITAREAESATLPEQGRNDTLKAALEAALEQLSTLEHYIANRAVHWQQSEAALAVENNRVKELETELQQRAQRSTQAQSRERRAESRAAALRQHLIEQADEAQAREQRLQEVQTQADTLASERDEATEQVATLQAEIAQWRELSDKLRIELANQTRDVQDRGQAADREARRAAKLAKKVSARDNRIEKLEAELANGVTERDALKQRTSQLEKALADERQTNNVTDETRSAHLAELEASLASLEQHQRDNESLSNRLNELAGQHDALNAQAATLAQELDARNAVVGHLENQVEQFRSTEADRSNAAATAETRIAELSARLEDRDSELETARAALEAAEADMQQAQEATASSSLQHADHLERIAHLEEQLEASVELAEELTQLQNSKERYKAEAESARETTTELDDTLLKQQEAMGELRKEIATSETRRHEQDLLIGELRRQLRDKDQQLARARSRGASFRPRSEHRGRQLEKTGSPRSAVPRPSERAPTRLLVCVSGDQEVHYPLYKDVLSIGRTGENDIQIRTHYVSRHHARIVVKDGEVYIEDLDSKNGVYLNSSLVKSETLKSGDRLRIGETEFRYFVAPPRNN